jgi:sporulation protein YlmC with PRC-barrel domain
VVLGHYGDKNMIAKYIGIAMLGTALISGAAFAQTNTTERSNTAMMHKDGEWRSSKLMGVNVYNDANEKIGDIQELILDKSGKVDHVVLGVGGFLGMGEHYVAVAFDKLKWASEPVRTSSTTTSDSKTTVGENRNSTVTGDAANRPVRAKDEMWYPDHAVFNATKDQLKAMPEFKYN